MADAFSFGRLDFDRSLGQGTAGRRRDPDEPFNLAVLGDFSGRSNRGLVEPIGQRRVWQVDLDNFETVMGRLGASLRLPMTRFSIGLEQNQALPATQAIELHFASAEDFHPDRISKQIASLAVLLEQRSRLRDPATAAKAVSELQALLASPPKASTSLPSAVPQSESNADTLARLLGGAPQPPARPTGLQSATGIERLIQKIAAPSIVAGATPQQTALLSVIELELTAQLRSLLHHEQFQALEAAWRGLDWLVRNFGAEENLKLFLLDISKAELAADLRAQDALELSGLCHIIRRQADDQPWAVWLGHYNFGASLEDIELLGRLAKVSAQARAPFLSGASPELAGCDSFNRHPDPHDWKEQLPAETSAAWDSLRQLPEAAFLGLALPRFLLRQPYGQDSDPIETFPFEEIPPDLAHETYLWGNPSMLCGYLLAAAFQAEGWDMRPGGYGEVDELPVHTFQQDGETKVKPCAEAWLSERAGQLLLEKGFMPLLSIKGRDAVHLAFFQSLAGKPFSIV